MIKIVLARSLVEYRNNLKVMLSFGMLFIFVILFLFFQQFFLSSGTVFLIFNESILSILGLILGLVFLYFLSFFISLTIYSIKRDVQHMNFDGYWNELMKKSAVKIFLMYFFTSIIVYVLSIIGLYFSISLLTAIVSFVIVALVMYVPQSVILDGADLKQAIEESVSFWKNNFLLSVLIILIGSALMFVIVLLEFLLELVLLPGIFLSFILVLVFLVPFIEQMKSYAFVLKFDLIKQPEVLSASLKPKPKIKIDAVRLREKNKGGKI